MAQYELDQDRAFQYLARVSQNSNVKLRDVAEELVLLTNERNSRPLECP
jgi:AmiR/NasT family two-component response regulator